MIIVLATFQKEKKWTKKKQRENRNIHLGDLMLSNRTTETASWN